MSLSTPEMNTKCNEPSILIKHSKSYLYILMISVSFLLVFGQTIIGMVNHWTIDLNYSHGFLISFVTGYMVWRKREVWMGKALSPSAWGLLMIMMGMVLHVVGNIGAELFTMRIAMIVTISGLVSYFAGNTVLSKLSFPIWYLIFMIPVPAIVWNAISFPLQLLATKAAALVIQVMGIPVLREGNTLHMANIELEVVDACSGLRSFITLMALTSAYAYFTSLGRIKKWILFASALPIALVVNIFRLSFTASLAYVGWTEFAEGFIHELSGMVTFMLAFLAVHVIHAVLSRFGS